MSGGPDGSDELPDGATGSEAAAVDFDRLDLVRHRLSGADRFVDLELQPAYAPDRLVCRYDTGYYPGTVTEARLEIRWFENDDFPIHYHEMHEFGSFDHRWDRHPSEHNAREHVHPGPAAPVPGEDTSHPRDWRAVLTQVLQEIDDRQRAFWIG